MTTLAKRYSQYIIGRFADVTIAPLLPPSAANLMQMRLQNWGHYFNKSETQFEEQWEQTIWPLIKEFDFTAVLELSPGAGRNTEKLSTLTSQLIAVDISQDALDQTWSRLNTMRGTCEIRYIRNNGSDLSMVPDGSVTTIYCWDSAVHFEKGVVLSYIREFARILKPGGSGFLHHSALGDLASDNIKRNPHWRSNVSAELVVQACHANGLTVTLQQAVPWPPITDCATIFRKHVVD
jgi:ubiquinone/menaquinone biosynthesis C-methylase UbiE